MTETVSGRTYTSTRVRGFAEWKPRAETMHLVERVQDILGRYQAQLPLTNRQIFYILVGSQESYPKTEQAYARLCEYMNRARRAQLIPFDAIRDDGTQSVGFAGWSSPAAWMRNIRRYADIYTHDLTEDQPYHVELWVEAGGMVPQAATVAADFGVVTYSAGGFNGLTDKYETAQRLARVTRGGRPAIVMHCGDYDPSGLSILDSLASDVAEFHHGLHHVAWSRAAHGANRWNHDDVDGYTPPVEFRRILITPAQIEQRGLPAAPQKGTDRRGEYMEETVQAEALPPDVLAAEIRNAIESVYDMDALEVARDLGDTERQEILDTLNSLNG